MKHYYLEFKPLIKAFCISDAVIEKCDGSLDVPMLSLAPKDYQRLGCAVPRPEAPTVGFLMGRDKDCYSADWNYILAIAKTGVKLRFLTYQHCELQMQGCNGLVLPGGAFDSPESYYADAKQTNIEFPTLRSKAYALCIRGAVARQIPVLGICAGAQMIAGEFGLKLYRNFDDVETPIEHYTHQDEAHRLDVVPNSPLARILNNQTQIFVNSRHRELVAPIRIQREMWAEANHVAAKDIQLPLDFYAFANDGVPEAWGSEDLHILCVQFHPEDLAAYGNSAMQGIYQWLADEIGKKVKA